MIDPAAEKPRPSRLRAFFHRLRQIDFPFKQAGKLTLVGALATIVGTLVGSYFQYNAWQEEKDLTRYKEDYANANQLLTEVLRVYSVPATLQYQLSLYDRTAVAEPASLDPIVQKTATELYEQYQTARFELLKSAPSLEQKVEMFFDWPAGLPPSNTFQKSIDLGEYLLSWGFDCSQNFPDTSASPAPKANIDWQRSRDHLATTLYCFEQMHRRLLLVLKWAAKERLDDTQRQKLRDDAILRVHASLIQFRVDKFTALAMNRIVQIRTRYRTRGFLCHLSDVFTGCRD
jgi:hypothetical protein